MKRLFSIFIRIVVFVKISIAALFIGIAVAMGFDSGVSLLPAIIAVIYLGTFVPSYIVIFLPTKTIFNPPIILKIYYCYVIAVVIAIGIVGASSQIRYAFTHSEMYRKIKYNKICFTNMVTVNTNDMLSVYNHDKLLVNLHSGQKVCLFFEKNENLLKLRATKCREIENEFGPNTYENLNIYDVMRQQLFVYDTKRATNTHFIISPSNQYDGGFQWIESR